VYWWGPSVGRVAPRCYGTIFPALGRRDDVFHLLMPHRPSGIAHKSPDKNESSAWLRRPGANFPGDWGRRRAFPRVSSAAAAASSASCPPRWWSQEAKQVRTIPAQSRRFPNMRKAPGHRCRHRRCSGCSRRCQRDGELRGVAQSPWGRATPQAPRKPLGMPALGKPFVVSGTDRSTRRRQTSS